MPGPNYYRGTPNSNAPMVTVTSPSGVSFSVNVASAPYFQAFINAAEARGYNLTQGGSSAGFNYRTIAGSNRWSQHAFGNAIDINQVGRGQVVGDYPGYLDDLARQYGLVPGSQFGDKGHFEWGGPNDKVALPDSQGGGPEGSNSLADLQFDTRDSHNPFDHPMAPDPGMKIPSDNEWTTSPGDRRFLPSGGDTYATNTLGDLYNSNLDEQRSLEVQSWNPSASTYSHPDDHVFPSLGDPNNLYAPTATTATNNQQFGPSDFIGQQFHSGFDINRFTSQYPNFPAGPIAPNNSVGAGHVLVGNEFLQGDQSGSSSQSFDLDFANAQRAAQGLEPLDTSLAPGEATTATYTHSGATPAGQPPPSYSGPQNLLGIGANSGQHYYSSNGGRTWTPVTGAAPQEVRFAQNSGTGNFTADQTARGYMGWNPADSVVNNTGATTDEGMNSFLNPGGATRGYVDPETGALSHVSNPNQYAPQRQWVTPSQAESAAQGLSFDVNKYNAWIMAHNPNSGPSPSFSTSGPTFAPPRADTGGG